MSTVLVSNSEVRSVMRLRGAALGGVALIVAGAVQADGGILSAAYRGDSPVSSDLLQYPWHGATALATTVTWGVTQLMITAAFLVFARSNATGSSRSGQIGARLAVAGSVLFTLGHAGTLLAADATVDDPSAVMVMALFSLGTLLVGAGFLLAGTATARAGWWSGWRRQAPLVVGIATVALIPLQFTPLLPVVVAVYSLTVVALGVAMLQETGGEPDPVARPTR